MITLTDLYKAFGTKRVLQGATLQIEQGESMVIIGGSGSGKSVLIKHIIGLLAPDSGSVKVEGQEVTTLKEKELYKMRRKFGMLFQNAALFDSLKVWENVAFTLLRQKKTSLVKARETATEKLRLVGLKDIEDLMPSELSGGMRKRVGLARAIAHNPEFILYDEPTTGLDPIMADVINELIIELKQKLKVTSVTITHDMVSAYKIADRIAMLYKGKIIGIGTPEEIKNTSNPVIKQFITGNAIGPITAEGA
ncbi:MAG: ABC transporter ATP-binding protein [Nitrospirae bacterium]|nr:ABC transporter ATP-binding protein [Nitrospirota bacterium]